MVSSELFSCQHLLQEALHKSNATDERLTQQFQLSRAMSSEIEGLKKNVELHKALNLVLTKLRNDCRRDLEAQRNLFEPLETTLYHISKELLIAKEEISVLEKRNEALQEMSALQHNKMVAMESKYISCRRKLNENTLCWFYQLLGVTGCEN